MKAYDCPKCQSKDVFIDDRGEQKALVCGDCGRWIKWIGKQELPLVERFIESRKMEQPEKETDVPLSLYELENLEVMLGMCTCMNGIQNKDKLVALREKFHTYSAKLK